MKFEQQNKGMRLDKWLWCARFYKTRALASDAIKAGKVRSPDKHCKPSSIITEGQSLSIKRGPYHYEILVKALARHRGPASEAVRLYEESQDSLKARERLAEQIKMNAPVSAAEKGRPSKRRRRQIIRFTRRGA